MVTMITYCISRKFQCIQSLVHFGRLPFQRYDKFGTLIENTYANITACCESYVNGHFIDLLLPDDCCLHETLSCNKGFELTHFYVWLLRIIYMQQSLTGKILFHVTLRQVSCKRHPAVRYSVQAQFCLKSPHPAGGFLAMCEGHYYEAP